MMLLTVVLATQDSTTGDAASRAAAVADQQPKSAMVDTTKTPDETGPAEPDFGPITSAWRHEVRLGNTISHRVQAPLYLMPTVGYGATRMISSLGMGVTLSLDGAFHEQGTGGTTTTEFKLVLRALADKQVLFRNAFGFRAGLGAGVAHSLFYVRAGGTGEFTSVFAPGGAARFTFDTRLTERLVVSIGGLGFIGKNAQDATIMVALNWN